MGEPEAGAETDAPITQGICHKCARLLCTGTGTPLQQFLDALPLPIIVIDSNVVLRAGNKQASAFLGKELPQIEGLLGGQVFECEYSRLPEGCGKTIHCSGCTFRRAATETYTTGRSKWRLPVAITRRTASGAETVSLLISTQKVGEVVFVRIDWVGGPPPPELWRNP
jgi:PAS domain-containing protein